MSKGVKRLFEQFQPENYQLNLAIDPNRMVFGGSVTITGKKVGRPSQRLTFHQKGLKFTSAKITKHDKKGDIAIPISRINTQKTFDEVRLHSSKMVYSGNYTIKIEFNGHITDGMTGIYPCYFRDRKDIKKLIMTQFESHYARQAFPCIDEPEAKATFELTLTTPNYVVLANTPIKKQIKLKNKLETTFETTPKMSPYLLAFVMGEMRSKSTKTKNGTKINVWATTTQPTSSLDFALEHAKKSVEYFEDYFGVPYPLQKLDHVACPDFSNGAMENWGLITYRERVLLAYPGETSQSTLEQIALVIAHETSHQWFGDLVTMKWWDDLWLNESFANMMEYQAVNTIDPEWHVWNMFVAQEGLSALRRDATYGVQSIKTTISHPDEIETLFDPSIVYAKGGRVLNMLKNFIGEDAFRRGLKLYFDKHALTNTTGEDLWKALSLASNQDIKRFMDPWLEQSGFPLISVGQAKNKISISQEHFLDNPKLASPDKLWTVPLFSGNKDIPASLSQTELSLTTGTGNFIHLNKDSLGHYLVRYISDKQKQTLVKLIADNKLGEADRLMLLNTSSMLARAGYEKYSDTLNLLEAYQNETSDNVWDIMALVISEAKRFIDLDKNLEPKLKSLVDKMTQSQLKVVGWEEVKSEPVAQQKLRALILGLSLYSENESTIAEGLKKFEAYKKDPGSVPAEIRDIVMSVAVKFGEESSIDYLLEKHDSSDNSDLKADICSSLTTTRDSKIATKLLDRIKDSKLIKPQDADRWLIYLLRNHYTKELAWDWMEDNWNWIEQTYAEDKSYDMLPRYASSICNTRPQADRFKKFFEPKMNEITLKRNIEMGLADIEARVAWLDRDLKPVQNFFKN